MLFYFTSFVFNMFRTLIYPSSGACDCVVELPHPSFCSCYVVCWRFGAHQITNTQRTENKTIDVVIQQHRRKLLMIDILMSETCWVHKKWNKTASDIKLVFYTSRIGYDLTLFVTQTWSHTVRCTLKIQVKYKLVPEPKNKAHEGKGEKLRPILTSAIDGDGWSASRPTRLPSIPAGNVARWVPELLWTLWTSNTLVLWPAIEPQTFVIQPAAWLLSRFS